MTDESALLAAVLAAPADDLPRLVYADWLEEHAGTVKCRACIDGDSIVTAFKKCAVCSGSGRVPNNFAERAEFVRVQCEIASITVELKDADSPPDLSDECGTEGCDCSKRTTLRRRERELWPVVREAIRRGLNERFPGEWCIHIESLGPIVEDTTAAIVRRGFVEEVRCTLAAFLGEPCGLCRGDGQIETGILAGGEWERLPDHERQPIPVVRCPSCSGTGRVGGCAAAVAASQPVTRWVLSDRRQNGAANSWLRDDELWEPYSLPRKLWWMLRNLWLHEQHDGEWLYFQTESAALDALSLACVKYARAAALGAGLSDEGAGRPHP
jgi:uncharacterized protein (TIGR02996 family)